MGSTRPRVFSPNFRIGGVVSPLVCSRSAPGWGGRPDLSLAVADDFYFVQLSDTHWGYKGPANPAATVELPRR